MRISDWSSDVCSSDLTIVESEVPLNDYVAEVALKPVTDGNRTFWSWSSRFRPPPGRERELTDLVSQGVYEAGFAAVRALDRKSTRLNSSHYCAYRMPSSA